MKVHLCIDKIVHKNIRDRVFRAKPTIGWWSKFDSLGKDCIYIRQRGRRYKIYYCELNNTSKIVFNKHIREMTK